MKHREGDNETREGKYIQSIIDRIERRIKKARRKGHASLSGSTKSHEPSQRLARLVTQRSIIKKLLEAPGSNNVTVIRNYKN